MSGDQSRDPGAALDRESDGVRRWVKVVGLVIAILILLFVVALLLGGLGGHKPRLHGLGQSFGGPDAARFAAAPPRLA